MSRDWLQEDLWRAHMSWLTPAWISKTADGRRSFSAKAWIDALEKARYKVAIFYTKQHDGFCTFPSRHCSVKPERDYFGECVHEAHSRGMRILAYHSSVLDVMLAAEHEDWRVRRRDGTPAEGFFTATFPGSYLCINNPAYRAVMIDQLSELLAYRPDGLWLDVYQPNSDHNCFCRFCQERFSRENEGKDIFETTGSAWYLKCYASFLEEIDALAKSSDPDCVITCNSGPKNLSIDRITDLLTHEGNSAAQDSAIAIAMRAFGKPYEVTYRMYTVVGSWAMKSRDAILLESATIAAHNGACSIELAPTNTAIIQQDPISTLAEVGTYIRAREKYLVHTLPVYDACYFIPDDSYGASWETRTLRSWDSVLQERDIPYGFATSDTDLAGFPLAICDGRAPIDERRAAKLAEYVRNGGQLIVECNVGAGGSAARELMTNLLGIEMKGHCETKVLYLSRIDERLREGMGMDPLVVEGEAALFKAVSAEALAYYTYPCGEKGVGKNVWMNVPPSIASSHDVAITVHGFGKGRAMFIGCPLGFSEIPKRKGLEHFDRRVFPVQLAANLARFMLKDPLLQATTPAGVEIVVNVQEQRHIVHVLNRYVEGEYYESRSGSLKLAGIHVVINEGRIGKVKRVFLVDDEGRLAEAAVTRTGAWMRIDFPALGVHAMAVLEH
jgi:hypothetical protein